jgi:hypothetical protein
VIELRDDCVIHSDEVPAQVSVFLIDTPDITAQTVDYQLKPSDLISSDPKIVQEANITERHDNPTHGVFG